MRTPFLLTTSTMILVLFGAGCASYRATDKTPVTIPAPQAPTPAATTNVPNNESGDLPRHPSGNVIVSTNTGNTASLNQMIPLSQPETMAWIKQRYQSLGMIVESDTPGEETSVVIFKKNNVTYTVRANAVNAGATYLSIVKTTN